MGPEELRSALDRLPEEELLRLRDQVRQAPDGSIQEIEGVQIPKEQALKLINQAMPIQDS